MLPSFLFVFSVVAALRTRNERLCAELLHRVALSPWAPQSLLLQLFIVCTLSAGVTAYVLLPQCTYHARKAVFVCRVGTSEDITVLSADIKAPLVCLALFDEYVILYSRVQQMYNTYSTLLSRRAAHVYTNTQWYTYNTNNDN